MGICMGNTDRTNGSILVNGRALDYVVERRSIRHPRLEFRSDRLLVILPKKWGDAAALLEEKRRWIAKKHAEITAAVAKLKTGANGMKSLPIFGELFEIQEGSSLVVDTKNRLIQFDPGDENHRGRLELILRRMLLPVLQEAAETYAGKFGVRFNRITIRKQRTKWGSCSTNGTLNFNLWLVCLPKEFICYLACHEVAHLKESNHRRPFWGLVGQEFPNYREMEKKLSGHWYFVHNCSRAVFPQGRSPF